MKITAKQLQQIIQEEILKEEWTDALDPKQILDKAKKAAAMAADDGKIDPKAAVAPEEPKEQPKEEPKEQPKKLTAGQLIQQHLKIARGLGFSKFPTRREIVSIKGKKEYKFKASAGNVVAPLSANPTRNYYGSSSVHSVRDISETSVVRKALLKAYAKSKASGLGRVFVGVVLPGGNLSSNKKGIRPMVSSVSQKMDVDWAFYAAPNIVRVHGGENKGNKTPQGKVIEVILAVDPNDSNELVFVPHPDPDLSDWSKYFK
jgi:hypothetical protein